MISNREWTLEDEIIYREQVDETQSDAISILEHAMQHVEADGTDQDVDDAVLILLTAEESIIQSLLNSEAL